MKKTALTALTLLTAVSLCGCSNTADSTSSEESTSQTTVSSVSSSSSAESSELPSISIPAQSYPGASSAFEIAASSTTTLEIIEKPEPTERHDDNRISYTAENVWSQGSTYTVSVSGAEQQGVGITDSTTYVKGKVYGDFRLEIVSGDDVVSSLKINVPRDDIFLILESSVDGIDYGFEILSSKTEFGSADFPDIIQLDFYRKTDYEVPQYARYFAVINGEICELDIYEGGVLVSPRGTHPKLRAAGMFIQQLCVKNGSGGYEVIQYEYRMDIANKRLNRKKVRFTGWNA